MQSVNNQNIYVASPDSQFVQTGKQKPAEGSLKKVAAVTAVAALIGAGISQSQLLSGENNMVGTITEKFMGTSSDLPEDTFQQYLNFIAKYGKTTQSQEEFEHRLQVFGQNYKRIIEHNASDAPFTMAVNQFADMTDEEFVKSKAGVIVPKSRSDKMKDFKFEIEEPESTLGGKFTSFLQVENTDSKNQTPASNLPDFKDWYEEGHVTEPENQSSCGGCWAFSSASATESLAHINGLDKKLMDYSVQQLIDCDVDNFACAGGWMYEGFNYISNKGVLLKKHYRPYQSNKHDCETTQGQLDNDYHIKGIGFTENDGRSNKEFKELLQKNPISVAIKISGRMAGYSHGVFTNDYLDCSQKDIEVDHGVLLVGYGKVTPDEPSILGHCKEYWIVRNSWGNYWGHHGFFKICADGVGTEKTPYGTCHINKYAVWPELTKNTKINPEHLKQEPF